MNPARFCPASRGALVLLVLCCLLAAQWLGLGHRVAHAGWQFAAGPMQVIESGPAQNDRSTDAYHSCAAFEDATLPAALTTPPYLAPLLPGAAVLALWTSYASWQPPFRCHFSSRAPPLS